MRTRAMALVLALAVVAGGCGEVDPTGAATGVVVDVVGDLTTVTEFTITTGLRERMTFVPAPDGDFAFPLPHLRDHLRSGVPVEVGWEREADTLWAVTLDDAEGDEHP